MRLGVHPGSLEVHPGYAKRIVGGRSANSYGFAGFIGVRYESLRVFHSGESSVVWLVGLILGHCSAHWVLSGLSCVTAVRTRVR